MIEMQWMDAGAYMGRGIRGENSAEVEHNYGPENKKDCPCDTCPMMMACGDKGTECAAFRNWATKGDYWDTDGWDTKTVLNNKTKKKVEVKYWHKSDVQRLIRAA